ncbi:hypothetical protein MMC17_003147 [Xylographa soralifera]|nr:hypothetical protein [Xylographa soralifera]
MHFLPKLRRALHIVFPCRPVGFRSLRPKKFFRKLFRTASARSPSSKSQPSLCETDQYDEDIPFDVFALQAEELCREFWPSVAPDDLKVEHIPGGSSNRVVGVTVHLEKAPKAMQNFLSLNLRSHTQDREATVASLPVSPLSVAQDLEAVENAPPTPPLSPTRDQEASDVPLRLSPLLLAQDPEATSDTQPAYPLSLGQGVGSKPILPLSPPLSILQDTEFTETPLPASPPPPKEDSISEDSSEQSYSTLATTLDSTPEAIPEASRSDPGQYILRIPRRYRYSNTSIDLEIATLRYIRTRVSFALPEIISFDLTPDNPIQSPYTLQKRLLGRSLNLQYHDDLNHQQRKAFVLQYAQILRELIEVDSPVAGDFGLVKDGDESGREVKILHYEDGWGTGDAFTGTPATNQGHKTLDVVLLQFKRQTDKILARDPYYDSTDEQGRLSEIAREMDELGCLGDNRFTLFHGDLEPRNIMCYVNRVGELSISGIVDWDDVKFAPRILSCIPPTWIWDWSDGDDNDIPNAYEVPKDPEMRELKDIFESMVGEEYLKLSRSPQHRLARYVIALAISGIHDWVDEARRKIVIAEWPEVRRALLENTCGV